MTDNTPLREKIKKSLEEGVKRNNILPTDWAMDRIETEIKQALKEFKEEYYKCGGTPNLISMGFDEILKKHFGSLADD